MFSRFCTRGVREPFVSNVNYFLRRIRELANFLVLGQVNVRYAKVGNDIEKRSAGVNIHDISDHAASKIFGHIWMGTYLY